MDARIHIHIHARIRSRSQPLEVWDWWDTERKGKAVNKFQTSLTRLHLTDKADICGRHRTCLCLGDLSTRSS